MNVQEGRLITRLHAEFDITPIPGGLPNRICPEDHLLLSSCNALKSWHYQTPKHRFIKQLDTFGACICLQMALKYQLVILSASHTA